MVTQNYYVSKNRLLLLICADRKFSWQGFRMVFFGNKRKRNRFSLNNILQV